MKKIIILLSAIILSISCESSYKYGDYSFTILNDGTVRFDKMQDKKISGTFYLPKKIYGRRVTQIGEKAFKDCKKITDITILSTITEIGKYAFEDCTSLKTVTFEDPYGWKAEDWRQEITPLTLTDRQKNAVFLNDKYKYYRWYKENSSESQSETGKENSDMKDITYRGRGVHFTMKPIAAVTGAMLGDNGQSNNQEHTVSLSAYYIGETEVTQELWQAVMGNNPSNFSGSARNPVETINWYDSIVFCNELTQKVSGLGISECVYYRDTSFSAIYTAADAVSSTVPHIKWDAKGFRLPTEAEWEYAAMGGQYHKYAGTDNETELTEYAWYKVNSDNMTHEVGTKKANKYGLYDMSGNVWEWCWDRYSSSTPASGQTDPQGASTGPHRINRGGSWDFGAKQVARTWRDIDVPEYRSIELGLRLVSRP